jgi:hypothetical protein
MPIMNTEACRSPDQHAHLLVDRQVERSTDASHPLAQPLFGGREQRREGFLPILRVQHPEASRCVAVAFEMQRVGLGTDPPDRFAPAPGDPCLPSGVLEIGIALRGQMKAPLEEERRDPGRVGCEDPAGHANEPIQCGPTLDREDAKRRGVACGGKEGHRMRCRGQRLDHRRAAGPRKRRPLIQAVPVSYQPGLRAAPSRIAALHGAARRLVTT